MHAAPAPANSLRNHPQTMHNTHELPPSDLPGTADVRCGYMGKHCDRPRSLKRDGRLHRFCMYHRERANLNQRRVDARKRLRGHEREEELSARENDEVRRREEELERQHENGGWWLNDQELDFLKDALFDEKHEDEDEDDERKSSPVFAIDPNRMW